MVNRQRSKARAYRTNRRGRIDKQTANGEKKLYFWQFPELSPKSSLEIPNYSSQFVSPGNPNSFPPGISRSFYEFEAAKRI